MKLKNRKHFQPRIESLENRCVLSAGPPSSVMTSVAPAAQTSTIGGASIVPAVMPQTVTAAQLSAADSSAVPAGMGAVTTLANLPVFNVATFGAKGDGVTDDTVAIRNALQAAQTAQGGIIYLPKGTYAVCPQATDPNRTGAIFTITTSNIVFEGDGPANTHLMGYCAGLQDPTTHWQVANGRVARFMMFSVNPTATAISGIQFRSLDIDGNAGYTGNFRVGGDPTTGDGWDTTHKAICIIASKPIDKILFFNCSVDNWRGEEVYGGGRQIGQISIVACRIYGTNASAISTSGNCLIDHVTIGGTAHGNDVLNGVENYEFPQQRLVVQNSTITTSSDPLHLHGNGVVFIGEAGASLLVQNTTLTQNQWGVYLSQSAHNVLIQQNTFVNNQQGVMTSAFAPAPRSPIGYSDITVANNRFEKSGTAFVEQTYQNAGIVNLVIKNNTVTNGAVLSGTFNGPASHWKGMVLDGNVLGSGATELGTFKGNYRPVFTNTVHNPSLA